MNTLLQERTRATVGHLLLGKGSVNTSKTIRGNRRRCFPWCLPRGYITRISKGAASYQKLREFSWRGHLSELLSRIGSSSGDGSRRWLRRNGKKWIRLRKEDSCVIWSDSEPFKSVARIRLVKTENSSLCVTVNWKYVDKRLRCNCL
jgi:hypothetical protein